MEQIDLARGTVDLVVGFKVVNPNAITLSARRVDYGVSFSGVTLVTGQNPQLDLEAEGRLRSSFQFTSTYPQWGGAW